MSVTGLAKGLSQVGRYVLTRKEQQREAKNRFMLENLKNAMWQRRLREETERQQYLQDRLLEQTKIREQAEVEKERLKGIAAKEKWDREAPERELEEKLINAKIQDLKDKALGKGYYGKKGATSEKYVTAKEREISRILNKKEEDRTDQEKAWLKNYFLGKESTDFKSLLLEGLGQEENDPLGIR